MSARTPRARSAAAVPRPDGGDAGPAEGPRVAPLGVELAEEVGDAVLAGEGDHVVAIERAGGGRHPRGIGRREAARWRAARSARPPGGEGARTWPRPARPASSPGPASPANSGRASMNQRSLRRREVTGPTITTAGLPRPAAAARPATASSLPSTTPCSARVPHWITAAGVAGSRPASWTRRSQTSARRRIAMSTHTVPRNEDPCGARRTGISRPARLVALTTKVSAGGEIAVGQGDPGVRRGAERGRDAGDDLEGDAGRGQGLRLLGSAPEQEGVPALEPHPPRAPRGPRRRAPPRSPPGWPASPPAPRRACRRTGPLPPAAPSPGGRDGRARRGGPRPPWRAAPPRGG